MGPGASAEKFTEAKNKGGDEEAGERGDDFLRYLLGTSCKSSLHIPSFRRVMIIREEESLKHAFQKLSREHFLAAPVIDSWRRFKGFISVADIVQHVSSMFWFKGTEEFVDFWQKEQVFQKATVKDVLKRQQHEAIPSEVFQSSTTFRALENMVLGQHRRLVVLNDQKEKAVANIFTQSMMISELDQRLESVSPTLRGMRVRDFMGKRPVLRILESDRALSAFHTMASQHVSAVAIVNDEGDITGVLSNRDLRGIGTSGEKFSRLFMSAKEYKKCVFKERPELLPRSRVFGRQVMFSVPKGPVYVRPNQTFEDVVRLMSDGNLHRVFVLEQDTDVPVSVVSQTDILRLLWCHYTNRDPDEIKKINAWNPR